MTVAPLKLAKDLAAGDQVMVHVTGAIGQQEPATVLAIVPSVQTVQRKVLMVTVRTKDGRDLHRTYGEYSAVRIAS